MKYYSEKLDKLFDTEKELKDAELDYTNTVENRIKDEMEILNTLKDLVFKFYEYSKKYDLEYSEMLLANICDMIYSAADYDGDEE